MKRWTLGDIAKGLGSVLEFGEPGTPISGISTDSRTLAKGSLFVPLVGESFDGHNYAEMAVAEGGAKALVWGRPERPEWLAGRTDIAIFQVTDTLAAYQALGLYWKIQCGARCVAVTGSVGKTTTKEILGHLLASQLAIHKSKANFNNDIGVPKTLLELAPDDDVVIVEMGMRGRGQIERLVKAAKPEIGIITSIGTSHLELLGSREEIARAKGELVEGLPVSGKAILPMSDDFFPLLRSLSSAPVVTFSAVPDCGADFCPEKIIAEDPRSTTFVWRSRECRLPLPGAHHLHDLFACLAAGHSLGVSEQAMIVAVETLQNPEGRAEWVDHSGSMFYVDAYNSAPESLRASLQVLRSCSGRKLAVLGDMLELGPQGLDAHREIGASLQSFEVDIAFCFGPLSEQMAAAARDAGVDARWFSKKDVLADSLARELRKGDFVLVKASRGMALETVVDSIKERVG